MNPNNLPKYQKNLQDISSTFLKYLKNPRKCKKKIMLHKTKTNNSNNSNMKEEKIIIKKDIRMSQNSQDYYKNLNQHL